MSSPEDQCENEIFSNDQELTTSSIPRDDEDVRSNDDNQLISSTISGDQEKDKSNNDQELTSSSTSRDHEDVRSMNDQQLTTSSMSGDHESGDDNHDREMQSVSVHGSPPFESLVNVVGGSEIYDVLMRCVQSFTSSESQFIELRQLWTDNDSVEETVEYLRTCPYFFAAFVRSIPSQHYGIGGEQLCQAWAAEKFRSGKPSVDIDKLM